MLTLVTTGEQDDVYRFGFGITDFYVCGHCGVFVAAAWGMEGVTLGVMNIRALDEADKFAVAPTKADFDREDVLARQMQRRGNWMPVRVQPARQRSHI